MKGTAAMSRRPQSESYDTRRRLLKSAEQEFALNGYDKASLRQICAHIGVTTGALYFFFKNKEDLFRNVLTPVTEKAIQILEDYKKYLLESDVRSIDDTPLGDEKTLNTFLDLLYDNRYVVKILVNNRDSEFVAHFFDELTDIISATIKAILYPNINQVKPYDEFITTWLAQTEMTTILNILKNDETREEADAHINSAVMFTQGGIRALVEEH